MINLIVMTVFFILASICFGLFMKGLENTDGVVCSITFTCWLVCSIFSFIGYGRFVENNTYDKISNIKTISITVEYIDMIGIRHYKVSSLDEIKVEKVK